MQFGHLRHDEVMGSIRRVGEAIIPALAGQAQIPEARSVSGSGAVAGRPEGRSRRSSEASPA
jgi:hypothetical protein